MSTYRRKHYQDVANQISESYRSVDKTVQVVTLIDMAHRFDSLFKLDNTNYKSDLFFKACGIDDMEKDLMGNLSYEDCVR